MTLKQKAVRAMSWSIADKLINQIGNFFIMAYLARLLGPESFGLIGMLAIFIAISQSLINSGFSQALVQRSKYATERDFSTVFLINLALSVLLYVALYAFAPWISDFYDEERLTDISRVLFLVLIINAFSVVVNARLAIKLDFRSTAVANTVSTLFGAAIGLYYGNQGYEHWALVIMTLVKASVNVLMVWWFCGWVPQLVFCMDSCRRLFGFGSKLLVAGLIAQVVNNLYVLLTGRYFNATQVGYLTQATSLTDRISGFLSSVLHGVTYPVMTSVNDDRDRMVAIYKQLIEASMLVTLPAMAGFATIADPFVRLFLGKEWLPIVPVITILCFARIITPISVINLGVLNAIGRSDLFLRVDLSKLPMTLCAVFLAVPHGVEVVAWAMLITTAISFFINAYYPGKLFGFGALSQLRVAWKLIAATAAMAGLISFISHSSPAVEIILKVLSGLLVYGCMLMLLKVEIFTKKLKAALDLRLG
ncbi:lipopolysaccharide biosynthesis protein [Marinobacter lipolyticus]|uniref:lipopolysaccharide biosynthesis protein n=1 Tax=Marinobacter lipolyticus TaxID=209639 RepID=UPI003A92C765